MGLYTPADAEKLSGVPRGKLVRWLRGHTIDNRFYEPLWTSQVDAEDTVLGFRDLLQARVAHALIGSGLSAQRLRSAISLAAGILASDHPFATARFKTDGKTLLLQSLQPGEDDRLIDLFSGGQYVMRTIIEPSLRGVEFEGLLAARWFPDGAKAGIVIDPQRQFGQPVDVLSGVPTRILARAVDVEGSIERAASVYSVPSSSIRRALAFEDRIAA